MAPRQSLKFVDVMLRWVLHLTGIVALTRDKFGDGGLVTSSHDIEVQSAGHVAIKD